jgi:hypothetical protein
VLGLDGLGRAPAAPCEKYLHDGCIRWSDDWMMIVMSMSKSTQNVLAQRWHLRKQVVRRAWLICPSPSSLFGLILIQLGLFLFITLWPLSQHCSPRKSTNTSGIPHLVKSYPLPTPATSCWNPAARRPGIRPSKTASAGSRKNYLCASAHPVYHLHHTCSIDAPEVDWHSPVWISQGQHFAPPRTTA